MAFPQAPQTSFASDNSAGAHPKVIEAIERANHGHVLAYGDDDETRQAVNRFRELFDRPIEVFFAFNGTGANVMGLTDLARPGDAVICTQRSHIACDETGAPEWVGGIKLVDLPSHDAKLVPAQITDQMEALGVMHHAQPRLVSITQSTELGTVYTLDEIAALSDEARRHGARLHLDGARIANAVAALGGNDDILGTIADLVDVISFGGTKNGGVLGEAVIYTDPELATRAIYTRKAVTQLPSKMRFIAAQFNALLTDGLWLELAANANAMATLLYREVSTIPGIDPGRAPQVNSLFPTLPDAAIAPLQDWSFFWEWNRPSVRWMTAWDTSAEDVHTFARGIAQILEKNS
ncbi:MAG: threonine aldolase [Ilumatobacter coccineus]|uniref:Threonine aldolase n=1 Tax=Ilumatobacter coccineus TaxID=467094 RepID=A0A2G6K7W1_9ACTN|nr:MAG: threonine aldolase [Ilumatobacter coccineus]